MSDLMHTGDGTGDPRPGASPEAQQATTMTATVERLRAELTELRRAARRQHLVEQAKGLLAERTGCGVDDAYLHLLRLARNRGVPPETAASILLDEAPAGVQADRAHTGSAAFDPRVHRTPPLPPAPGRKDLAAGRTASRAAAASLGSFASASATASRGASAGASAGVSPGAAVGACPRAVPAQPDDLPRVERLGAALRQAERLGNLGWSEWNLRGDIVSWSDQLYAIFGRDPADGPPTGSQLAEQVLDEDLPITESVKRQLLERREAVDAEFRIRRGDEIRRLRMMAEPVLDAAGEPCGLRSVYQDVTAARRTEQALAASREQLERQRVRMTDERHIAVEFQRSVLPLPSTYVEKPGLRAAVRYLPAGIAARVGGDWYETTAIDDSEVFLAVGDASGHGLNAAAAMARLRNALSGLAFTGAAPDELLGWLNQVVLHWPRSLTATVVTGRYSPQRRVLTWANAGHLPPILIRDGRPAFLEPPEGVMLGSVDQPAFAVRELDLAAGDLLLLYTDGLVERRGQDIDKGLDRLLEAAGECEGTDPVHCVDHVLTALEAPNPDDDTCLVAIRIT